MRIYSRIDSDGVKRFRIEKDPCDIINKHNFCAGGGGEGGLLLDRRASLSQSGGNRGCSTHRGKRRFP